MKVGEGVGLVGWSGEVGVRGEEDGGSFPGLEKGKTFLPVEVRTRQPQAEVC